MNKLNRLLSAAALVAAANGPAFADQAPAPEVVAIAQVQAPETAVSIAAMSVSADSAKSQKAAWQRPASHYVFRGSAFAAAGRIGTQQ